MQIQQNYITYNSRISPSKPQRKVTSLPCDSVSFSGHAKIENCSLSDISYLIHQTALGRELKTKLFVRDYALENFQNKDTVRIVSGGCSTGEEAATYSMLLHPLGDKLDILGIDLGKQAIKQANTGKYIFEVPKKGVNLLEHFTSVDASPYSDSYLFSTKNDGLSAEQSYFKALFNEFFEKTDKKVRTPFWEWLHNSLEKRNGYAPLELDRYEYKLKDKAAKNCRFMVGDIRDIETLTGGEPVEVISFNNALYHLTTCTCDNGERFKWSNGEEIVENLATKFRNCLSDKGIVVFGEDEGPQLLDDVVVPKTMKKLGFNPLNKTNSHEANVWQKA